MRARAGAGGREAALGLVLLSWRLALALEPMPAEVRVFSTPAPLPTTTITVRAAPGAVVEDRTVGARPAADGQGMASAGETFRDEIRLVLRGSPATQAAAVEVADDLVSLVRVQPGETGTEVVVFVRQPVSYTVTRPSGAGEVVLAIRGRPVAPRARPARAAAPDDDQVAIDAAQVTYDQERDVVTARGDVTITRGALTLRADEVRYDRRAGVVEAAGNVVLTDPESTIGGSAARIDLNDESGWMEDADAEFPRTGYRLTSSRVEKGVGPCYRIEHGRFTTCRCGGLEKPDWSVGGARTEIELDGIGVVRGATFRVKNVPVLWVPVLAFPALTERASGLLMPRFGYSNRRGFQYEQPFFWNISKSQDATVALDVETSARIGLLGEYRYALSRTARGTIGGGYWNESIRSAGADEVRSSQVPPPEAPINRWLALGRAEQPLDRDSELYLDAFAVSDDTLLKEINNFSSALDGGLRARSTRFTRTRAGYLRTWHGGLVQAEGDYYQDLIDPQEFAPQRAPNLQAEHALPLLGNRVVGRLAGQVVNFQRREGFDGFRGDLAPELFVPFQLGPVIHGSVTGRYHGTFYRLGDDQQIARVVPEDPDVAQSFRLAVASDGTPRLPLLDRTRTRGVPVVRARLGSELARVYDFQFLGLQKLRHSIEPLASFLYVPRTGQDLGQVRLCPSGPCSQFPGETVRRTLFSRGYLFDELDAINRRTFFAYGVTTRLLGRFGGPADPTPAVPDDALDDDWLGHDPEAAPAPADAPPAAVRAAPTRELLRLSALQGVDASRDINTDSPLANLDLQFRLTPIDWMSFGYETSLDVAGGALAAQSARIDVREPGWGPSSSNPFQNPSSLTLSYRFVEENVNVRGGSAAQQRLFANLGTQNVIGGLYVRLGQYVGVAFGAVYDLNDGQLVNERGRTRRIGPHFILRDYLLRFISPCNCWAAEFGVSDNFDTDETLFRFQLTLLGLGSFGQGATSMRTYYGIAPLPSLGIRPPGALGSLSSF